MITATVAIILGSVIVAKPKGTNPHRMLGRVYVACMAFVCGSAFFIYNLYGTFGPFHWTSVGQTGCLIAGLVPLFRRRVDSNWKAKHAFYMSWSYVGLLAALAGEITARVPGAPFDLVVWSSAGAVVFAGSRVLKRKLGAAWRPPVWNDDGSASPPKRVYA